jgi:hypothetical protein
MLDHLNADHLRQTSSNDRERTPASTAPKHVLTSQPDVEIADLERMFRQPSRPHVRRLAIVVAIAVLIVLACGVAVLG